MALVNAFTKIITKNTFLNLQKLSLEREMFRNNLLSITLSVALFGLTACNGNDSSSPAAPSATLANQYQNVIDRSGTPDRKSTRLNSSHT